MSAWLASSEMRNLGFSASSSCSSLLIDKMQRTTTDERATTDAVSANTSGKL